MYWKKICSKNNKIMIILVISINRGVTSELNIPINGIIHLLGVYLLNGIIYTPNKWNIPFI
jgi:hypothetical protein